MPFRHTQIKTNHNRSFVALYNLLGRHNQFKIGCVRSGRSVIDTKRMPTTVITVITAPNKPREMQATKMSINTITNITGRILAQFPSKPAFCFAYGSGVKRQHGYIEHRSKNTLIDLIISVDDAEKWHADNLLANPKHYADLKVLGASNIAKIQENYGARVYCNTLIPLSDIDCSMKYGVITTKHLIKDLTDWTDLYVAGRLHKPVEILQEPNSDQLKTALAKNLENAVRVALLMLPSKFSRYEFFHTIANLSYKGDFRMVFGENKKKVKNIVEPQLHEFYQLYLPHMAQFKWCLYLGDTDKNQNIHQDKAIHVIRRHIEQLPFTVSNQLMLDEFIEAKEAGLWRLASNPTLPELISRAVANIVWSSSAKQSLKNIPTAGLTKAMRYAWQKALKTFSK